MNGSEDSIPRRTVGEDPKDWFSEKELEVIGIFVLVGGALLLLTGYGVGLVLHYGIKAMHESGLFMRFVPFYVVEIMLTITLVGLSMLMASIGYQKYPMMYWISVVLTLTAGFTATFYSNVLMANICFGLAIFWCGLAMASSAD